MALSRRSSRSESPIWPGFVDAMTSLLMVLMFVLRRLGRAKAGPLALRRDLDNLNDGIRYYCHISALLWCRCVGQWKNLIQIEQRQGTARGPRHITRI
jgi:hypothetical protein